MCKICLETKIANMAAGYLSNKEKKFFEENPEAKAFYKTQGNDSEPEYYPCIMVMQQTASMGRHEISYEIAVDSNGEMYYTGKVF